MAAHLTDRQKKRIIADYVEVGSYSAVAKKHNVSKDTVRRVVSGDAKTVQKAQRKKEQNTVEMLEYMDSRKEKAQQVLDLYLDALMSREKLATASLNQVATAFGILVDKFTKAADAKPIAPNGDDGLLKALADNASVLFDDGDDSAALQTASEENGE